MFWHRNKLLSIEKLRTLLSYANQNITSLVFCSDNFSKLEVLKKNNLKFKKQSILRFKLQRQLIIDLRLTINSKLLKKHQKYVKRHQKA